MYRKISNSRLKHWDFILFDLIVLQIAYVFPVLYGMVLLIRMKIRYTEILRLSSVCWISVPLFFWKATEELCAEDISRN